MPDEEWVRTLARAVTDKSDRELARTQFRPATVITYVAATSLATGIASVHIDGDPMDNIVQVPSLLGVGLTAGDRVMVVFDPPSGGYVVGFGAEPIFVPSEQPQIISARAPIPVVFGAATAGTSLFLGAGIWQKWVDTGQGGPMTFDPAIDGAFHAVVDTYVQFTYSFLLQTDYTSTAGWGWYLNAAWIWNGGFLGAGTNGEAHGDYRRHMNEAVDIAVPNNRWVNGCGWLEIPAGGMFGLYYTYNDPQILAHSVDEAVMGIMAFAK